MSPLTMYDSVEVSTVPDNPQAVAGYVGGSWPTYDGLVAKFPNAHHLSIAVNASERARCLDIENGDAVPSQGPGWLQGTADKTQGKPVLYTFASQSQAVIDACAGAGIPRDSWLLWSAHWTYSPHICAPGVCGYPAADLTQYSDKALGRNLDVSLVGDGVFGPPPPPPDPNNYLWFPDSKIFRHLNERAIVQKYDKLRATQTPTHHPNRPMLALLRAQLRLLAGRVYAVAHFSRPPAWNDSRRLGWRYQQLIQRAQGQRLV